MRVTPADIEANIIHEHYFTAEEAVLKTSDVSQYVHSALRNMTFCVLVLKNGYVITGKSACADSRNFDLQLGRSIARTDAINQIWPLMDYELRSKLFLREETSWQERLVREHEELMDRMTKLMEFMNSTHYRQLSEQAAMDLRIQLEAMLQYSGALEARRRNLAV